MHDTVPVAVIQCTGDLAGELARLFLLELPMRDNIVEHLTTVDIFKQHVPVICGAHDIAHATDIGMVHEADNGRFTRSTNFLGAIGPFGLTLIAMLFERLSRDNFDGSLKPQKSEPTPRIEVYPGEGEGDRGKKKEKGRG